MDAQHLIEQLRLQRTHTCTLPDGKKVRFLRPPETELPRFIGGVQKEHLVEYVVGWDFTAADLLGAALASPTPVEFDREVWREVLNDRAHYLPPLAEDMLKVATDYLLKQGATAKNSSPSSTQPVAASSRAKKTTRR